MNSEVLMQQFNNLLKEYQNISQQYQDSITKNAKNTFKTIANAMIVNNSNNSSNVPSTTVEACQQECLKSPTCSSGTFYATDQLCALTQGAIKIKSQPNATAFAATPLYYNTVLQQLNKQLIQLQEQIMQEMEKEKTQYKANKTKEAQKQKAMQQNYQILIKERTDLERMRQENLEINQVLDNGTSTITSVQYQYMLYFVVVTILFVGLLKTM